VSQNEINGEKKMRDLDMTDLDEILKMAEHKLLAERGNGLRHYLCEKVNSERFSRQEKAWLARLIKEIDYFRSKMENEMFKELPEQAETGIYYPVG
jgi:hypothetical protein